MSAPWINTRSSIDESCYLTGCNRHINRRERDVFFLKHEDVFIERNTDPAAERTVYVWCSATDAFKKRFLQATCNFLICCYVSGKGNWSVKKPFADDWICTLLRSVRWDLRRTQGCFPGSKLSCNFQDESNHFKNSEVDTFAKYCITRLSYLKIHHLDHIVENIWIFWTLFTLDAFPCEYYNVPIEASYRRTSKRMKKISRDRPGACVMLSWKHGLHMYTASPHGSQMENLGCTQLLW